MIGGASGGHGDHGAGAHRLEQSATIENDSGGLVIVPDGDDDELADLADIGRCLGRFGARGARG